MITDRFLFSKIGLFFRFKIQVTSFICLFILIINRIFMQVKSL
jgi:hypothetical protein